MLTSLKFFFNFLESTFISFLKVGMTFALFKSSGKKDSEKHFYFHKIYSTYIHVFFNYLSWCIVFLKGFSRIENFSQRLNTWLPHFTKRKIRFIRFIIHYCNYTWVVFEFFNDFFQRVLNMFRTNRSSLHCKSSDGTIFAKNLLNVSATRLLPDTILVLSSISAILFLILFLSEKNGLTVCQKLLLSTTFFVSRLLKMEFFSLRKRDAQ